MNRFKSGIKNLKCDAFAECLNDLTNKFVGTVIVAAIIFFTLGYVFTDSDANE